MGPFNKNDAPLIRIKNRNCFKMRILLNMHAKKKRYIFPGGFLPQLELLVLRNDFVVSKKCTCPGWFRLYSKVLVRSID